jgi:DNA-dependent RNA polymerase auxiliary subunit epsilon
MVMSRSNTKEINLKISSNDNIENLIKGNSFNIQFNKIQTQGIALEIVNSLGNKVFQIESLSNQPTPQHITTGNLTTGIYFVKVYANKKVYVQRVFITNN